MCHYAVGCGSKGVSVTIQMKATEQYLAALFGFSQFAKSARERKKFKYLERVSKWKREWDFDGQPEFNEC